MIQKESTYQKTSVCLPYKIAYAEVVASFAYNTAKVFGASDPTAMQLRQIAEESFVFAVGEGVHHSDDEYVLSMYSDEKGVVIECLYKGLPLTLRKAYTTSGESLSKDAELDSISLTMLRNMVDSISFEDCGINGWKITLRKDCDLTPLIEDKEPAKAMADENSVYNTFATPEDAYDIAVTTYKTYGTTYYDADFYVPDLIAQHIENQEVVLSLTKWKEKIIGMLGFVPITRYLASIDYGMVPMEYRKMGAGKKSLSHILQNIEQLGPDAVIYCDCVTSHIGSQALMQSFIGTSFCFSAYDIPIYYGYSSANNSRESLLFKISPLQKSHTWDLFVPVEHISLFNDLLSRLKCTANIQAYNSLPEEAEANSEIVDRNEFECDPRAKYLRLTHCGRDIDSALEKCIIECLSNGILTICLAIKLNVNMPASLTQSLHKAGFFFTGFLPTMDHQWEIEYQYMAHQNFDYEKVKIFSPEDKRLMEYILKDRELADNTI